MPRKSKARLYLRFRMPDGKQSPHCPALYDKKSRIRPFWCLVKGVEEQHKDGTYYRRAKRDGKWKWESLGNDANAAAARLDVTPIVPRKRGASATPVAPSVSNGYRIDDEIAIYLSNVAKLAPKTYQAYKRSLELFRQSCKKIYMHQIGKQDLQAFDSFLIEEGNEDRTRHNRHPPLFRHQNRLLIAEHSTPPARRLKIGSQNPHPNVAKSATLRTGHPALHLTGWDGRQVTKVTSAVTEPLVYQGMTRFHRCTTHWLPVAVKKIPISCCRDGFPGLIVFKKLRNERRHDDGLREYGDPR